MNQSANILYSCSVKIRRWIIKHEIDTNGSELNNTHSGRTSRTESEHYEGQSKRKVSYFIIITSFDAIRFFKSKKYWTYFLGPRIIVVINARFKFKNDDNWFGKPACKQARTCSFLFLLLLTFGPLFGISNNKQSRMCAWNIAAEIYSGEVHAHTIVAGATLFVGLTWRRVPLCTSSLGVGVLAVSRSESSSRFSDSALASGRCSIATKYGTYCSSYSRAN